MKEESGKLEKYRLKIKQILSTPLPIKPGCTNELMVRTITLEDDTKALFNDFADCVERYLVPDGAFVPIKGLANKLPEHALRISATLALIENLHTPRLERHYLDSGIEIVSYYAEEALRLSHDDMVDPDILLAEKLLSWLQNSWQEDHISLPDIYQRRLNVLDTKARQRK